MVHRGDGDEPVRIVVQQRARLLREGLAALLDDEAGFEVVGQVATHDELVELLARTRPDVVIVGLGHDDDLGALLAQMHGQDWAPRVVTLHTDLAPGSVEARRDAGLTFISLRSGADSLLDVLRGPPAVGDRPRPAPVEASDQDVSEPLLTHRELQVLIGISDGRTIRETAAALGVSPKTVENHKQRVFAKLGVENQAHAVAVAVRRGLLGPAHRPPGRRGSAS